MKTKSNFKLLVVMAILLLAMCIFNANVVQATETITDPQEILNLVPATIEVDMLESEVFNTGGFEDETFNKNMDLINQKITKVFTDNDIDLKALNLQFTNLSCYDLYEDIHQVTLHLFQNDERGIPIEVAERKINIKYKNTSSYNDTDKNYVLEKAKRLSNAIVVSYNDTDFGESEFYKKLENTINDKSIKIISNYGATGGGASDITELGCFVALYKNDVLYKTMDIVSLAFNTIVIPDNIQDTDEAYINYALPKIKEIWSNFEVSNVQKITGKIDEEYDIVNDGTYYKIALNSNDWARVILKKAKTTKVVDNVAISNSSATINATNIDKTSSIYNEMLEKIKEKGYSNIFNAYELHLSSGTISNGLTITFSLGTENNGKQAIVLHKKSNGSYEEFTKTIENGKVSIEVTELSPFMVALKDTETTETTESNTNTNTNNNKVLDNEPKTGVADYTILASVIALISIGGLTILKFKK